jgi:hypothetical protein
LAAGHLDQLKTFSAAAFTGHTPLAEEPKEIKPLYGDLK